MAWYLSDSQNVNIDNQLTFLSNPGNNGEVVYNVSGLPTWKKITGISRFIDTTNGVQDMNTGPTPINFNTEVFNDANISYGVTQFNINDEGYYTIDFQCLLSNGKAQTTFSVVVNGTVVYTQLSTEVDINYYIPFSMEYAGFFSSGDRIEIYGEKYQNGPNYLSTDPVYNNPVTQLIITKQ